MDTEENLILGVCNPSSSMYGWVKSYDGHILIEYAFYVLLYEDELLRSKWTQILPEAGELRVGHEDCKSKTNA